MKEEGKKISRTTAGLRDALFDQLERLRDRKIDADEAKAFSEVARTIVSTVEVQLEFERMKLAWTAPQHLSQMNLIPPLDVALLPAEDEKDKEGKA